MSSGWLFFTHLGHGLPHAFISSRSSSETQVCVVFLMWVASGRPVLENVFRELVRNINLCCVLVLVERSMEGQCRRVQRQYSSPSCRRSERDKCTWWPPYQHLWALRWQGGSVYIVLICQLYGGKRFISYSPAKCVWGVISICDARGLDFLPSWHYLGHCTSILFNTCRIVNICCKYNI